MSETKPSQLIDTSRRDFLRMGTATTLGLTLAAQLQAEAVPAASAATMIDVPFESRSARIAIVGLGGRGTSLLKDLLATDAEIVGLCQVPGTQPHACHSA
ncbi:MAG: twin-arginine translocation signal domain-containing protein [Janthinobacterium lividum]